MKDKSLNRLLAACLHLPLALLILTTLNPSLLAQSVPPFINYQGRLTDQAGRPSAGGSYTIQFRIWDSAINSATSDLIWGQQQEVTVQSNGVFNVLLGTTNATALSPTPTVSDLSSAFTGLNCFLGVTVVASNGVYLGQIEMAPRQQLLSVPFAVQAQFAQQASSLVTNLANALCPPGTIVAYMGTNAPSGWMLCDGSLVNRTAFATLFNVIGTASGSGDGVTTFNLPDLRGMFLRGMNGAQTDTNYSDPDVQSRTNLFAGGNVGNTVGSVQLDGFQNHEHLPLSGNFLVYGSGAIPTTAGAGNGPQSSSTGPVLPQSGVRVTSETRPKNIYVNYIIKY